MGNMDKIKNEADDLVGKGKEALGKLTGDKDTQAEGQVDQAEASAKKTGESVKDAAGDAKDSAKDLLN